MKKMTTLIVLAAAAAALIGGFFVIRALSKDQDREEEVLLFQAEALSRIEVEYKGESLSFEKGPDLWTYPEDPGFPLNAAYVRDMENRLKDLKTAHVFSEENPEFGLADPACVIDAEAADGTAVHCELGKVNGTSDVVYAQVNGQICALDDSVAQCFQHTLREMARKDLIPKLQAYETREITVENRHGKLTVCREDGSWVFSDARDGESGAFSGGRAADEESVKQILAAVSGTALGELTVYHPTEEDLLFYGVSDPLYAVSVKNDKADLELVIGQCERDDALYAYLPQWDCLYAAEHAAAEVADMTEEDLQNRKLFTAEYADLETITYRYEEKGQETEITDSDTRWEVYYLLRNMRAEGFAEEAAAAEGSADKVVHPEFHLTLHLKEEDIPLSWGVYDENFYCVSRPDGTQILVSKKEIASVYALLASPES